MRQAFLQGRSTVKMWGGCGSGNDFSRPRHIETTPPNATAQELESSKI
jgi:hypothetical protein